MMIQYTGKWKEERDRIVQNNRKSEKITTGMERKQREGQTANKKVEVHNNW